MRRDDRTQYVRAFPPMKTAAGQYAKLLVALAGAVITTIQTQYPAAQWAPAVTAFLSAVLVYAVPNTPPGSTPK
jgi:hypothetical protein